MRMRRLAWAGAFMVIPGHARAEWTTRSLAGTTIELYTPASTSPIGEGRALFVVLHGCGQTPADLRTYGHFEGTAEAFGLVVALPAVPGGGVLTGCWDYYGTGHARTDAHEDTVLTLTEALTGDPRIGIDPAQVYLAGLSSGGGLGLVLGCLAPERFAGLVIAAGPALGTTALEIFTVATTAADATAICRDYAGEHAGAFLDQLAVTFTDTLDYTVAQGYAAINAEMFATLYANGATLASASFELAAAPGSDPAGTEDLLEDKGGPRIARLMSTNGIGHVWPSGSGETPPLGSFVGGAGLDLTRYAAAFFAAHNRRVASSKGGDEGTGSTTGDTSGTTTSESSAGDEDATSEDAGSETPSTSDASTSDHASTSSTVTTGNAGPDADAPPAAGCTCELSPNASANASFYLSFVLTGLRRRRS